MTRSTGGWLEVAALVLVNLLWAAQYPAYAIAGAAMEPAALNFWTLVAALLLLLPWWLRDRARRREPRGDGKGSRVIAYLLLGVLGIVPPSVLLSWGIAHSSASNGAILSLTIPVLMTVLGVLMLGERLTPTAAPVPRARTRRNAPHFDRRPCERVVRTRSAGR